MASLLKNVASQNITFVMVTTAGVADTAATVTVKVVKDNGAQATGGGTVTNCGGGQYNYAPTQAETNATNVGFLFTATGDIPENLDFHTDQVDGNNLPKVDVVDWNGTAVVSPATAGIPDVNVKNYNNQTAATDANNLPKVDTEDWKGGIITAPATTGIPDVNTKNINNVSAAGVTTVNANQGTTQPINFTGTAGLALAQADTRNFLGQPVVLDANNLPEVDTQDWKGTVVATPATAGIPDINVKNFNNVAAPSLPTNFSVLAIDGNGNVSITSNVKKNTLTNGFMFLMTDNVNHNPDPGLTVTATRSIDGGAFVACANSPTAVSNGVYTINLASADVNGNHIMFRFTASGADDRLVEVITQP